jgi:hypothetical protein
MPAITPRRVRVSPQALYQDLDAEIFIVDVVKRRYFALDELGSRVWSLLAQDGDITHAIESIVAEYAVDRQTVETDVAHLISRLRAEGLLVSTD